MNLKERSKKLRTDIPAFFVALKKKETPLAAKILAGITIFMPYSEKLLILNYLDFYGNNIMVR